VIIDSKVDGALSESELAAMGNGVVTMIASELFGKGYRGNVIISTVRFSYSFSFSNFVFSFSSRAIPMPTVTSSPLLSRAIAPLSPAGSSSLSIRQAVQHPTPSAPSMSLTA